MEFKFKKSDNGIDLRALRDDVQQDAHQRVLLVEFHRSIAVAVLDAGDDIEILL